MDLTRKDKWTHDIDTQYNTTPFLSIQSKKETAYC